MRARSRRALLWEGGQQFICCVAAAFGAGDELSAYVNSALRGRVSEGYEGRRDLEDRARRSARDAKHGGQGCEAKGRACRDSF